MRKLSLTFALFLAMPVHGTNVRLEDPGTHPQTVPVWNAHGNVMELDDILGKVTLFRTLRVDPIQERGLIEISRTREHFVVRILSDLLVPGVTKIPEVRVSIERLELGDPPTLVPLFTYHHDPQGNETYTECGVPSGPQTLVASSCSGQDRKSLEDITSFLIQHFAQWRHVGELVREHTKLGPPSPAEGLEDSHFMIQEKLFPWNLADDPPNAWEQRFGDNYER